MRGKKKKEKEEEEEENIIAFLFRVCGIVCSWVGCVSPLLPSGCLGENQKTAEREREMKGLQANEKVEEKEEEGKKKE